MLKLEILTPEMFAKVGADDLGKRRQQIWISLRLVAEYKFGILNFGQSRPVLIAGIKFPTHYAD